MLRHLKYSLGLHISLGSSDVHVSLAMPMYDCYVCGQKFFCKIVKKNKNRRKCIKHRFSKAAAGALGGRTTVATAVKGPASRMASTSQYRWRTVSPAASRNALDLRARLTTAPGYIFSKITHDATGSPYVKNGMVSMRLCWQGQREYSSASRFCMTLKKKLVFKCN